MSLDLPLAQGTRFDYQDESVLIMSYYVDDDTYRLRFADGHIEDWDRWRVHSYAKD